MKTILIVDDSIFMRKFLKHRIQQYSYTVVGEAAAGKSAIHIYKQFKPDIVLLDFTMPDISGLTVLKEILKINPNAKVVMCSSMGTEYNINEAINEGAIDFVVKPYFERLEEILMRLST